MADESIKQTILVALGICLVCSLLIATAAVSLSSIQAENKRLDKIKNILIAGGLYGENIDIATVFTDKIVPVMIDLGTGETVGTDRLDDVLNIRDFDIKEIAKHAEYGHSLPPDADIARIDRMPKYMVVYSVKENEALPKIILPVYGRGLYSMLYGFLALDKELRKVIGITFYEQGETAGLGGEIANPQWQEKWQGKEVFDETGEVKLTVIKGAVNPAAHEARHQIDGISGATMTSRGVDHLVKFWLGKNGYGPFLNKLASRED